VGVLITALDLVPPFRFAARLASIWRLGFGATLLLVKMGC
jgi:hypothetical protein